VSNPALFADFKKRVAEKLACGNDTPVASTTTYKVVDGDTLWGISTKFKLTVAELKSLNGLKSDIINPGDVLKVVKTANPSPTPVAPTPAKPAPTPPQAVRPFPGIISRANQGGTVTDRKLVQKVVGVAQDGVIGPATERAIKAYQSRHGLVADGIVGPATWNVMF
jgi:peptidoglycan hydrolase-like protein with peptidoglycan-binding domain